jgi:hypothetical protein
VTSKMTMTSPAASITVNTPRGPTVEVQSKGGQGDGRSGDLQYEDWRRHPVAEAVDPTGLGVEHLVQALDVQPRRAVGRCHVERLSGHRPQLALDLPARGHGPGLGRTAGYRLGNVDARVGELPEQGE